jgi:ribosomal protein S18 acetylase RimI-like enzyme
MSPTAFEIVELDAAALERHLDELAGILRACVHAGASVSFILPFELDQARAFWQRKVAPGVAARTRVLLGARVGARLVGTVQLDCDTPPNQRHRADVSKLLVHPEQRRLGIARALMERIETYAPASDRHLLTLDTASEGACALYLSLGYQKVGEIPGYARDPITDRLDATIIMFKDLRKRAP